MECRRVDSFSVCWFICLGVRVGFHPSLYLVLRGKTHALSYMTCERDRTVQEGNLSHPRQHLRQTCSHQFGTAREVATHVISSPKWPAFRCLSKQPSTLEQTSFVTIFGACRVQSPPHPLSPLPSPSHSDMCEGGCFTPRVDPQCGPSESAQMLHSLAYGVRPKTFSLRNDRAFALSVCGKRGQRYCTFVAMLCSLSPSLLLFVCFLFVCFLSNHVGVNFALHQIQGREAIISTEVRVCQSKSR